MSDAGERGIRVLHVDDQAELGKLVALHLERQREDMTVATETSPRAALDRLEGGRFDCVVSDHDMPEQNGLEFLRDVREFYPDLPFILFTGKGNEEIASDAISAGVTEYLQKDTGTDQYTVLANRIERAVEENRAKEALEESERMLSTLISNLPGMVYRCRHEPDRPMTFVSDGAETLTGYCSSAIEDGAVDWTGDVLADEEAADELWGRIQTALSADEPFEVTYRIETADGERRWVWERGRAVATEDGRGAIEGFVTDVTARKERERELEAERQFTENVVNSLEDLFFVAGPDGSLLRWNDRVSRWTGYTDAELEQMRVAELFPPSERDTVGPAIERALSGETVHFQADVARPGGEGVPVEFRGTAITDADGDVTGVCGVGRDVSERVERERELRRYKTLVENVADPMYALSADGRVELANQAMAGLLDEPREEIIGRDVREFVPDRDYRTGREVVRALLQDDRSWASFELQSFADDGIRDSEDTVAALTDEDGQFTGSVGVIRDVTERKNRERRLAEVASVVDDDLREAVETLADRVERARESGDHADLTGARVTLDHLERLVDGLARRAQVGESVEETTTVALPQVAHNAWDDVPADEACLEVAASGTVEADPDRLRTLLEYLFTSALTEGCEPGQAVRTAEDATARSEPVVGDGGDEELQIRVGETADGFFVSDSAGHLRPGGDDRNLAVVKSIVDAHGWRVNLVERSEGGTRVEVGTVTRSER